MITLKFLLLLGFIPTVFSEGLKGTYEQIIIFSCQGALGQYKFGCDGLFWKCACEYPPLFGSVVQCIDAYLPATASKEKSRERLIESCAKYGHVEGLTMDSIRQSFDNSSTFIISPDDSDFNKADIQYVPILPHRSDVVPKLKDYRAFLGNLDISQYYGVLINVYWLGVLVWFAAFNRLKLSSLNDKLIGRQINFLRSRLSLPLLFGTHFQPFIYLSNLTSLLPTTAESICLLGYFFLNTIFLFCGFSIYESNTIFGPHIFVQAARYIADRSGVLAFAHFPLLVLFAGRNNLLINFSGLQYSSFMIFHKWTARVMVIDALVHTTAYLSLMVPTGKLAYHIRELWLQLGIVAMALNVLILLFAVHTIRVKYYEFFLITHIIFAIWFFISCYQHCVKFGWLDWIEAALLLWAGDRLIRLYRLVKFGAPFAQIEFISDQTFKVSVPRPHNWNPYPGCFVFIHFLHPQVFWQSHPFTIMDSVLNDEEVTIYIKAKEGLTKKVLDIIGDDITRMRVSLEGPYGVQSPVEKFDNVLLFAGGNGIPGPFYHAVHLAQRPLIPKQRVRLIWIIRQVQSIKWFEEELKQITNTNIECDIYITRNFNPDAILAIPTVHQFSKRIKFHSGRAPTQKIMLDEFNNARGIVGIVTCGPSIMCDEVRHFVANNLNECPYRVDLFEELQVW